jgi:hypothetical protein
MQVVELIERRFDLPLALGKRLDARHNRPGKTPHISSVFVAQSMDIYQRETSHIKETGRLLSATSLASTVSHKNDRQSFPLVILCRFQRKSDMGRATLVHLVHSIGLWIHSLHSP